MAGYEDYLRLLQSQQQAVPLNNVYGGINHMLSSAIQGFLIGKDRKQKKQATEALNAAWGGMGGSLNPVDGVRTSLTNLGENPYAQDMLLKLGLGDIEDAGKTRNKMALLGYSGEVEKDVYRDRRAADTAYAGSEFGFRSKLSDQEYRQRINEIERQSGLDLRNLRENHSLSNERTLNQIQAQLGADLTRSRNDVWEYGAKSAIDTEHKDLQGESALDRALRLARGQADIGVDEYGRKKDIDIAAYPSLNPETFSQPQPMIGPDGRPVITQAGNRGTVRPIEGYAPYDEKAPGGVGGSIPAASPVESFFQSKGIEGDIARVLIGVGPKVAAGAEITPTERLAFNFAMSQATQPKTMEVNGQVVSIPPMTREQIFQGLMQGGEVQQPTLPAQAPYSRQSLLNALIQQESGGNPTAVSSVGARGLMQLMPKTAVEVAREIGMDGFKVDWLDNPEINQLLGTYYLDKQLEKFGGNVPMALAAYNAGPHRVDQWRKKYGDPLSGEISVREWVDKIPYKETKGYVNNIMKNLAPDTAPQVSVVPVPPSEKQSLELERMRADVAKRQADLEDKRRSSEQTTAKKEALKSAMLGRLDSAEALLQQPDASVSGLSGVAASYLPGTPSNKLWYDIEAIKNQFTGANLDMMSGVLSDTDLAILGGLAGSLSPMMPAEEKLRTLRDMRSIITAGSGGSSPTTDVTKMTDEELMKALGLQK